MVAIIRYSDKNGITTTLTGSNLDTSVYMAELLHQLQPTLQRVRTRRYLKNKRPRFYLRVALMASKKGTTAIVNLKDDRGIEVGLSETCNRFKDVHGIVDFINSSLRNTGWLQ